MLFLGREKKMIVSSHVLNKDIVAEWLRRWIANPLFIERVSSNLTDVDTLLVAWTPCSWVYPSSHRDLSTPLSLEPLKTQSLDRAGLPQVDCHSYVKWRRLVPENSIDGKTYELPVSIKLIPLKAGSEIWRGNNQ